MFSRFRLIIGIYKIFRIKSIVIITIKSPGLNHITLAWAIFLFLHSFNSAYFAILFNIPSAGKAFVPVIMNRLITAWEECIDDLREQRISQEKQIIINIFSYCGITFCKIYMYGILVTK